MLRIAKYLKPYLMLFFLSVILLFAQANLDLTLPDYLSRIVNTGIQQNGVEDSIPTAMRASQMERLLIFVSADNQVTVLDAYSLITPEDANVSDYTETYPVLTDEPIYVLNELSENGRDTLRLPLAKSLLIVSGIQRTIENPEAMLAGGGMDLGFDPTQVPAGMDIFTLLGQMSKEQKAEISNAIDAQLEVLGDNMVEQSAITAVKAEYESLGMDIEKLQQNYILRVGGVMVLFTLLSAACTISVGYLSAKIAAGVGRDLRGDVFKKVESFSNAEFDQIPTASLITRSTNDVTQLQMVTMIMVRMVFYAPIMGVGGIIRAIGKGSSMWWTIAVAVMVLLTLIITIVSIALPKFKIVQKLIDRLNLVARENLSGMMVIRAFNMQAFEEDRFEKANLDLTANSLFIARIMAFMMPMMMFILNVLSVGIIWVGAHQVAEGNMQVGDMMAFLQYGMQIVFAFLMLSMLFIILPRASVSADRIADVLETDPSISDPKDPKKFNQGFKGSVEFKNVSFRYPGAEENVLHDLNFVAQRGQTTAFIGSTGSGKSTVVNLIPRFYDVTEGEILVDGLDIRDLTQHDLREKIGYVPQKGMLFSGTIESNLKFADGTASEERMMEAIQIAQASEFVTSKENGMAAEISQAGANVSGGQKQRLSIARALVKQAPIYIFDDTFSALDFKTDAALRRALKEKTNDSTMLIVTQRISTVKNAEQIVVLDNGKIVGKGTHEELMEDCKTYQEIALSQLSLEELS